MVMVSPPLSVASKEISSSTRSITVCSRRAPMFSTVEFTCAAMSASASMASSVKFSVDALGLHQRHVLLDEARLRLRQDAAQVLRRQRLQLDADRQAALQLGQQVRRLGHVEGARGDEQHVVGLHRPVLGRDRGALDQRQQVALHALARDVGADAAALRARADLVDLVEEHDAVVLDAADGLAARSGPGRAACRSPARSACRRPGRRSCVRGLVRWPKRLAQHLAEVDHADLAAGNVEGRELRPASRPPGSRSPCR